MKVLSFEDVKAKIAKESRREFHLLLGNGFSRAYDDSIFSYNALQDFVSQIEDDDLKAIFGVVRTENFEIIMQQLEDVVRMIDAFGGDESLARRIRSASEKLRTSLLTAVESLHPEHVFTMPEGRVRRCADFLRTFLETGGSVFSTNYDLLLYWVLMRQEDLPHSDGFGQELVERENWVDPNTPEYESDLTYGPNMSGQNVFYLHGALPFFDVGYAVLKEKYQDRKYLLQNISTRMKNGEYPIFVAAGDGTQKLNHIRHNHYLAACYDALCSATGSLVTFGFNFGDSDSHIIDAINQASRFRTGRGGCLYSLYIGTYSKTDRDHIQRILPKFATKKVYAFDASTADVWGQDDA